MFTYRKRGYTWMIYEHGLRIGMAFQVAGKWTACDRYNKRLCGGLATRKEAAAFLHWARMNGAAV